MPSSSSTPSLAPPSANSRNSPSANNSPTGSGSPRNKDGGVNLFLCSIRRIDADVLRREVARPIAGTGFAGVQVHNQRNVFGEKFVAGGALVEIQRLPAPQYGNACHLDVHQSGVKLYAGPPSGGKNAAPVQAAARQGGFPQRR